MRARWGQRGAGALAGRGRRLRADREPTARPLRGQEAKRREGALGAQPSATTKGIRSRHQGSLFHVKPAPDRHPDVPHGTFSSSAPQGVATGHNDRYILCRLFPRHDLPRPPTGSASAQASGGGFRARRRWVSRADRKSSFGWLTCRPGWRRIRAAIHNPVDRLVGQTDLREVPWTFSALRAVPAARCPRRLEGEGRRREARSARDRAEPRSRAGCRPEPRGARACAAAPPPAGSRRRCTA